MPYRLCRTGGEARVAVSSAVMRGVPATSAGNCTWHARSTEMHRHTAAGPDPADGDQVVAAQDRCALSIKPCHKSLPFWFA